MFGDEGLGTGDGGRFGVGLADGDLVGGGAELLGERVQQLERALVLLLGQARRLQPSLLVGIAVAGDLEFVEFGPDFLETGLRGFAERDLAGLEVPDDLVAEFDGDRGVGEPGKAGATGRLAVALLGQLLLDLKACGAAAALGGHQRAEGIPVGIVLLRDLPCIRRPQRERTPGGIAEGAFVLAVKFGVRERLDHVVLGGHAVSFLAVPGAIYAHPPLPWYPDSSLSQ